MIKPKAKEAPKWVSEQARRNEQGFGCGGLIFAHLILRLGNKYSYTLKICTF